MARMKQRGERVGTGKESVSRNQPYESLQSFCGPLMIQRLSREAVKPFEDNRCNRISARRGRILKRLAANFKPSHRRRITCAIKKSATFGIAVPFDGQAHRALGRMKIARLECQLIRIEQRGG